MIVGVTGHRPSKLAIAGYSGYAADNPLRGAIVDAIKHLLVELSATKGISGMALGVDQYFALACMHLEIPFTAAIPFAGQESRWPAASQHAYRNLLTSAAEIIYVCKPGYERWKMQARNEWMVDRCATLIAVWDGSSGGTANTVLYANKVGRSVHFLNPRELEQACAAVTDQ